MTRTRASTPEWGGRRDPQGSWPDRRDRDRQPASRAPEVKATQV